MTRLHELRKRLSRLRRRRRRIRLSTAFSALILTALWILAAAFLLDWWLEMSRSQRLVCWLAGAGVAIWAFGRYTLPWLGHRETDLDMALLVQRTQRIDSDLVAAVQFESPEAAEWGSVQLEQAVIDRVAASGARLNVMRGIPRRPLLRRSALLVLTLAAWGAVVYLAPDHVSTFFHRLALGARHYPTDTVIESIAVKSREIDPTGPDAPVDWTAATSHAVDPVQPGDKPVKILYGHRVRLEVQCSGELPEKGRAELTVQRSGLRQTLELARVGRSNVYAGELERLREAIRYQLYLGDAWTDPAELTVTELPRVELQLEVIPPPYVTAREEETPKIPAGLRQVSVVEGSRVIARLDSKSPLEQATVTLRRKQLDSDETAQCEMRRDESDKSATPGTRWVLDSQDTWLASVTERVEFEVDVTDADGQHLETPIVGAVRIRIDPPPLVEGRVTTHYVVPNGLPTVAYRATDNYGVARVSLLYEVMRKTGLPEEEKEITIFSVPAGRLPPTDTQSGKRYQFDLEPLGLEKGDQVKIALKAVDFRGDREGKATLDDPIVLTVTDQRGIEELISEGDRESAVQLDQMIRHELGIRDLGIGDSP